jgi:DNA-binding response OmpR family regulator
MPTILVVDDEVYIRDLIKKALKDSEYTILEASEGNQAQEILRSNDVDIMIIDLVMPHKGGIETFMETRESNRDIKIIAISGKIRTENDSIQELAQQFRVDAVLSKPFDLGELRTKVKALL